MILAEGQNILELLKGAIDEGADLPAAQPITAGPKFHWFGYYDKLQLDPTGRYALAMEVDFEHRSPLAGDEIRIGMVDLHSGNRWIELGRSAAWNWQQGCMLQWLPGSASEVLWNDRREGRFVCVILDVATGQQRVLPWPAYHVSPDGRWAVGTDFARINHMRPGYGYAGIEDSNRDALAPADSGIYRLDLATGQQEPLVSLADIAAIAYPSPAQGDKHYFNHLQWSPDGQRFLFFHRWRRADWNRDPALGGFSTRVFTMSRTGQDLRLLSNGPRASHYLWRDRSHVLLTDPGRFRLFVDDGRGQATVLLEAPDGHPGFVAGTDWLLADSYPFDGCHYLYLYNFATRQVRPLGRFESPAPYKGEWRCDLHPRITPDGRCVLFDSPHGGAGRQAYLLDLPEDIQDPS